MRKFIFLFFVLLFSCSNSNNKISDNESTDFKNFNQNNDKGDFQKFINLLPKVSLPYFINCEKCCVHPDIDHDNKLIKLFLPERATLVGLLTFTDEYVVVLVTYPADGTFPSVIVYNLVGEVIDERSFMTKWCGRSYDYLGLQYFKVSKDLQISSIDTSYLFTLDSISHEIIDTVKMEVSRIDYLINNKGKLVEKN